MGVVDDVLGMSLAINNWKTENASKIVTPIPIFSPTSSNV